MINKNASGSVAVYGLSTEGYRIASSLAVRGSKVSLIDESARMAITLKPDIARTYPDVASLMEDEPLLALEPIDVAINDSSYLFFAPRIRKIGQDAKTDATTKFRDAMRALSKGCSIVYTLPTGIGGNNENIALIEHVTGMSVGKDFFYYYMPNTAGGIFADEVVIGSMKSEIDEQISRIVYDPNLCGKLTFIDIRSAEFVHAIRILGHYTGTATILEICKQARDDKVSAELVRGSFSDVYLDDIANGLYDLRAIGSSISGAGPLMYLVNGTIKGTEGYVKYIIDKIRETLKKRDLKASRTKVMIAWTLDLNEMRGDRIELLYSLESKLKDYIGDVELQQGPMVDLFSTDKTIIVIACSKKDFASVKSRNKQISDFIIIKANPVCEIIGQI